MKKGGKAVATLGSSLGGGGGRDRGVGHHFEPSENARKLV